MASQKEFAKSVSELEIIFRTHWEMLEITLLDHDRGLLNNSQIMCYNFFSMQVLQENLKVSEPSSDSMGAAQQNRLCC